MLNIDVGCRRPYQLILDCAGGGDDPHYTGTIGQSPFEYVCHYAKLILQHAYYKVLVRDNIQVVSNRTSRMLNILIDEDKFLQFHGEEYARLDLDQGAFQEEESRIAAFAFGSLLLLHAPLAYYDQLRKVYRDGIVHYYAWRSLICQIKSDWVTLLTPVRHTNDFEFKRLC